ncbi:MAG TPA: CPBP family intramembrane glutamic endopeptidase [Bryobacteraceae bacterium]|nr:CPBP family intramembrane glutamic endopeptidase [Bryobacteraceae bacterium]
MKKARGSALPAGFLAALLIGWLVLTAAGILYAEFKHVPNRAALPVLAGFLIEYPFYLVGAFPNLRKRLAGPHFPALLVISALLPYIACCGLSGHLAPLAVLQLAALALVLGFWYRVLPANLITDLAFLTFLAVALLSPFFERIYPATVPGLPVAILGRVAVFHMAVLILIVQRQIPETGYGFLPNLREWRLGALHFLGFLPLAACVAIPTKTVRLVHPAPLWKTAGIFLAFLWVVALFEEFIFRGALLGWLEQRMPRAAALLLTSALFGCAHLWFRGFPNWHWALLAGVLGWFCGHARNQAGSIRAGVVTHALAVAAWRGFFS